jgi:hypothetical protein
MNNADFITVVSGLPRSGTSMMMSMLQAGGLEPMVDNIRQADEDNPKGYFEFERVKQLKKDHAWLADAKGRLVKVISQLLYDLPSTYPYRIVFLRRNMDEILASQRQMLIRKGTHQEEGVADAEMARILNTHVAQVLKWVAVQPNIVLLVADYNELLKDARLHIDRLSEFLGGGLNTAAMAKVVDQALYRQRKAGS